MCAVLLPIFEYFWILIFYRKDHMRDQFILSKV
jgi:hypothetical protein